MTHPEHQSTPYGRGPYNQGPYQEHSIEAPDDELGQEPVSTASTDAEEQS